MFPPGPALAALSGAGQMMCRVSAAGLSAVAMLSALAFFGPRPVPPAVFGSLAVYLSDVDHDVALFLFTGLL